MPAMLRPLSKAGEFTHLFGHLGGELLELKREPEDLQEEDLQDIYAIAMGPVPGPHDLLPNPNNNITGYTGPGISGTTEFSANSTTSLKCGKCSCKFDWKADFYGKTIGCTSEVRKFSCTCERGGCGYGKIVKCLKNLASGNCEQHQQEVSCL
ncbi:uncharacterized protein LOC142577943 [Dermacentor variabilis]|uniref:uncharacterized protein LOC142577943 n=1 Tax=Dermacentor variabilis TaxID=34621 RepID=UPI003F5C8A84